LKSRIELLEKNGEFKATQDDIMEKQMEMLDTLRKIRDAIVSNPIQNYSTNELIRLSEENEKLKKINAKQKYRIDHLVMTIYELQEKLNLMNDANI
jgi:ERCC4-type nuclease